MKRPLIIILSVVGVFLLLGISTMGMFGSSARSFNSISNQLPGMGYGGGGGGGEAPAVEMPALVEPAFMDAAGAPLPSGELAKSADVVQAQDRLVIQNADLAIVVKDPKARMKEIADLANEMGGFVVSSNLYQTSYGPNAVQIPEATITIRVPAEKLDEALDKIKTDAVDVQYENRSGQDVTSIYVDLQSQLKAKQAAEKKLLEIMDKAEKAEDVLAIYLQVQSVGTEIEVLKGQIKYYDESVSLSAVSVRLIAEAGTQEIEIGPWKPAGSAKEAVQDLIYFFQNFVDFLIRFVIFTLPALILIAIPLALVFFGGRAFIRRLRKPKSIAEVKEEGKK